MLEKLFEHFPADKEGQSLILTRPDFGPSHKDEVSISEIIHKGNLGGFKNRLSYLSIIERGVLAQ